MGIPKDADPIELFRTWLEDAKKTDLTEPTAASLATASGDGAPSVRMILLKDASPEGFVFYTNLKSRKGRELAENPQAALCFYWMPLGRQVRVRGPVQPVRPEVADQYFESRDFLSRMGAWASRQSEPLEGRFELEKRMAKYTARYGKYPPRPPFWSGFRVIPKEIEFWEAGSYRLHDRVLFTREDGGPGWTAENLYP